MEECNEGGVIDATHDVVALGFELFDNTLEGSPKRIIELLKDKTVQKTLQKAIQKALKAEAKRLVSLQRANKPITSKEGSKVLTTIEKNLSEASQSILKKEIEGKGEYKRLKDGIEKVKCTFRESPVGIFYDEHKSLLIVVASGLALGGVGAMYTTRSGDWAASQLASFATKKARFKILGKMELGAKKIIFKPSQRKVDLTTFTTAKWTSVQTSLDLNIGFKEDSLTKASASGEVKIEVTKSTNVTGKVIKSTTLIGRGKVGYVDSTKPGEQNLTYKLELGADFIDNGSNSKLKLQIRSHISQEQTKRSIGASGKLIYGITGGNGRSPPINLTIDANTKRTEIFQPTGASKQQNEFKIALGVGVEF